MSSAAQRAALLALINEACRASARLHRACTLIGLAARCRHRTNTPHFRRLNIPQFDL
jgi:hypothetical protein